MKSDNLEKWYFFRSDQPVGPLVEQEIALLFESKFIQEETLVWRESKPEWISAAIVFDGSSTLLQNTSPKHNDDCTSKIQPRFEDWIIDNQVPFSRLGAKYIDVSLFSIIISIPLWLTTDYLFELAGWRWREWQRFQPFFVYFTSLPISLIAGGVLLGKYGTTPGKSVFGIRVLNKDFHPMGWATAFQRETSIWGRGMGLGLPLVMQAIMAMCFFELKREGMLRWEKKDHLYLLHPDLGVRGQKKSQGALICVVLLLGSLALSVL